MLREAPNKAVGIRFLVDRQANLRRRATGHDRPVGLDARGGIRCLRQCRLALGILIAGDQEQEGLASFLGWRRGPFANGLFRRRAWRPCRRGRDDRETEIALAVLLEEHRHVAVRQDARVAVAGSALVIHQLPRPGLAVVVAAEKGPIGARGGGRGTRVEDQARFVAGRPRIAEYRALTARVGKVALKPSLRRVFRATFGHDGVGAFSFDSSGVEEQRTVEEFDTPGFGHQRSGPQHAAGLPRLAPVVAVDGARHAGTGEPEVHRHNEATGMLAAFQHNASTRASTAVGSSMRRLVLKWSNELTGARC